jgi:hypothetical protein
MKGRSLSDPKAEVSRLSYSVRLSDRIQLTIGSDDWVLIADCQSIGRSAVVTVKSVFIVANSIPSITLPSTVILYLHTGWWSAM